MAAKFFGYLMIVAGIFVSLAGGCFIFLAGALGDGAMTGLLPLGAGVALIVFGIRLVRKPGNPEP